MYICQSRVTEYLPKKFTTSVRGQIKADHWSFHLFGDMGIDANTVCHASTTETCSEACSSRENFHSIETTDRLS